MALEAQTVAAQILDASAVTPPAPASPPTAAGASKPSAQAGSTPAPAADDKVSPKLQLIMQRERAALARENAAKAKEAEIEGKLKSFGDREAKLTEFENLKKTNPLKALELLGLSFDEFTRIALADGKVPPEVQVANLEKKITSIEEQREADARKAAEDQKAAEQRQYDAQITGFKTEIGKHIKDQSERYEFLHFEYPSEEDRNELVFGLVDEHFERTRKAAAEKLEAEGKDPSEAVGEILTIAQAADKAEQHYEQKYDKARSLKKLQALLAPRPAPAAAKLPIPTSQKPKTLTNQMSATPAASAPRTRPVTDEDRIQKAIAFARSLRPNV